MRPEANLRRLAEMGIEVYLPRAPMPGVAAPVAGQDDTARPVPAAGVVLLADKAAARFAADLVRALRFAGIDCVVEEDARADTLASASGVIMLGQAAARRAGALVPARRQGEIAWIVTADFATLGQDVAARRALWSELKRLSRAGSPARRLPPRR